MLATRSLAARPQGQPERPRRGATGQGGGGQSESYTQWQAEFQQASQNNSKRKQTTSPPDSDDGSCRPAITELGYSSWIDTFYARVRACGKMLGSGGSGGLAVSNKKLTKDVGSWTCTVSVTLYQDKKTAQLLYWSSTVSPSSCSHIGLSVSS